MYFKRSIMGGIAVALVAALPLTVVANEITVVGTGDGVKVLKAIGEAFGGKYQGNIVTVPPSIGSGGGVKEVGGDKYSIGRVARGIKDKEKHFGLSYLPFAKVPVIFFVNKNLGIKNLSSQQVLDIYSGKLTNWSEVGGPDGKIRVVRREDGDSSLSRLQKSFPGFKAITLTSKSKTVFSTPESIDLVEKKTNTIGFGPHDVALGANVDIISIDGIAPLDAGYPTTTTLGFVFKEENNKGSIKDFIAFATSADVHDIIVAAGGIPSK